MSHANNHVKGSTFEPPNELHFLALRVGATHDVMSWVISWRQEIRSWVDLLMTYFWHHQYHASFGLIYTTSWCHEKKKSFLWKGPKQVVTFLMTYDFSLPRAHRRLFLWKVSDHHFLLISKSLGSGFEFFALFLIFVMLLPELSNRGCNLSTVCFSLKDFLLYWRLGGCSISHLQQAPL